LECSNWFSIYDNWSIINLLLLISMLFHWLYNCNNELSEYKYIQQTCWTLLNYYQTLLDFNFTIRALDNFVLPLAQLFIVKISPLNTIFWTPTLSCAENSLNMEMIFFFIIIVKVKLFLTLFKNC